MVISFHSYFEDPQNAYSVLVEGVYGFFSGKRQQPKIYNIYLPTYLPTLTWVSTYDLQFQKRMPCDLSYRDKSTRGLIMGSAFYSRDSPAIKNVSSPQEDCECKASILQAYLLRTHCTAYQGILLVCQNKKITVP